MEPHKCERPPRRGSVSDGLNAMPCLGAGIAGYNHFRHAQQADFTSRCFAIPFAGDGAWTPLAVLANKIASTLREMVQERHLERRTITTGAGDSRRPFDDEVRL